MYRPGETGRPVGGVGRLRYGTRRGVAGFDARGTGATAWVTGAHCPGSAKLIHSYQYNFNPNLNSCGAFYNYFRLPSVSPNIILSYCEKIFWKFLIYRAREIPFRADRGAGRRERASECCVAQTGLNRPLSDSRYRPCARSNRGSHPAPRFEPLPSRRPRANSCTRYRLGETC